MMKRTPKTPALAKLAMLLLFAIATVAILDTTSISAQELGRTITSPFGVANPYMNASDASESGTDGDTFVDPETGESDTSSATPSALPTPKESTPASTFPMMPEKRLEASLQVPLGFPLQMTLTRAWMSSMKTKNT